MRCRVYLLGPCRAPRFERGVKETRKVRQKKRKYVSFLLFLCLHMRHAREAVSPGTKTAVCSA